MTVCLHPAAASDPSRRAAVQAETGLTAVVRGAQVILTDRPGPQPSVRRWYVRAARPAAPEGAA